jgi:transcriptional regulator with XRE-family HTH domain
MLSTLLRQRRLELGLTQRQVADALGIKSPDFICLVEKGRKRLELDRIPQLAQVLTLDVLEVCRQALEERAPALAAALAGVTQHE